MNKNHLIAINFILFISFFVPWINIDEKLSMNGSKVELSGYDIMDILESTENFFISQIKSIGKELEKDEIDYNIEWENFKAEVLPLLGIIANEYDLTKIAPQNRFIINDLPGSHIDSEQQIMKISTFNNIVIY